MQGKDSFGGPMDRRIGQGRRPDPDRRSWLLLETCGSRGPSCPAVLMEVGELKGPSGGISRRGLPAGLRRWVLVLVVALLLRVFNSYLAGTKEWLETSRISILRYEASVEFDWPPKEVWVRADLSIQAGEDSSAWLHRTLPLVLQPKARVDGVAAEDGTELGYTRIGPALIIRPPADGDGWSGLCGETGVLRLTLSYRAIPRGGDFGGGRDQLLLGAEPWLPALSADMPASVSLAVDCPEEVLVVCSSVQGDTVLRDGTADSPPHARRWDWDGPVLAQDIWLFASKDYLVVPASAEDPDVCCIVDRRSEAVAKHIAAVASEAIRYLEAHLGPRGGRPFVFVQAVLPEGEDNISGRGGMGIAALSAKSWTDSEHPDENLARDILAVHELVHNWWGRTFRQQRRPGDLVLVEGMAEYWAYRTLAETTAGGDLTVLLSRQRDWLARTLESQGDPVPVSRIVDNTTGLRYLIYEKSSAVIQMLECYAGREAFDLGCRRFLDDPGAHSGGLARWLELIGESSERDLGPFVSAWFDGTGLPRLTAVEAHLEDCPEGGRQLRVSVSQEKPHFPFVFRGVLVFGDGPQVPVVLQVPAEGTATQVLTLPPDVEPPIRLRLDPDRLGAFANRTVELSRLLNIKVDGQE